MVSLHPQTKSKSAQILHVGAGLQVLFSYNDPVAVLRTGESGLSPNPVYRVDRARSRTSEEHIERFSEGREVEKLHRHTFLLMCHLDLAQHIEATLFDELADHRNAIPKEGEDRTH